MDGYSVWDEASRDYDAEARIVAQANFRVASSGVMHFLALAESRDEFDGRLMLAASQVRALADESGLSLDEVTSSLRNRWEMIYEAGAFQKAFEKAREVGGQVADRAGEAAEQAKAGLGEAAEQAKTKAGEAADAVGDAVSGAGEDVADTAQMFKRNMDPHKGEVTDAIVDGIKRIPRFMVDPAGATVKTVKEVGTPIARGVIKTIKEKREKTGSNDGKAPCYGAEMAATGGDYGDGICPDEAMVDASVGVCDACASEAKDWYTKNWNTKESSRRTAARGVRQEGGRWKVVDDQGHTVSVHDTKEQAVSSYKSMKRTQQPKAPSVKKPASNTASRLNFNQAVTDDPACEGCGSYDESLSRGDSFCGRCVSAGIPDLMNSSVHERKKNAENNRRRRASLSEQVWDDIYKMAEWKVGDPDPATTRSNRSPEATPGTPEHKELLTQENDKRKRDKDAEVNRRSKEQQTHWIQNNTAISSRKIGDKSRCGHVEAEQTFIHGDPDMGLQFKCDSCGKNAGACCGTAVDAGDRMMFFCGPCHDESNMELDDYAHKQALLQVIGATLHCRNCGKTADESEFGQNEGPECPECGSKEVFEDDQQTTASRKSAVGDTNVPQGMSDYGKNEGPNLAGAKFTPDGSKPDVPSKAPAEPIKNPGQFNPKSNGGDIGMGLEPDTSSMYDSTTTASKADLLIATAMVLENNPQLSDDEAQKIAFSVLSTMTVEAETFRARPDAMSGSTQSGPLSVGLGNAMIDGANKLFNKKVPGGKGGPSAGGMSINKLLQGPDTALPEMGKAVNKKITSSPKSNAVAETPKAAPVAKPATEQVSQTGDAAPADATEQKPQSFRQDLVDNYSQPGVARDIWKDIAEVSVGAVGTVTPLGATLIPEAVMGHGAENLVRDVYRPFHDTKEQRRQPASQPSQAPQPQGPGNPPSA